MLLAASNWPFGMLTIAERMISEEYAPSKRLKAITAEKNADMFNTGEITK